MAAFVSVPLALWLAALVARPRRPRLGNEVEELVYVRLLGRHERLLLLALAATGVLFVAAVLSLPGRIDPPVASPAVGRFCADDNATMGPPSCLTRDADGSWTSEVLRAGSGWQVVATGTAHVPLTGG